jgi:hypothetical protein
LAARTRHGNEFVATEVIGKRRVGRACIASDGGPLKVRLNAPNTLTRLVIVADLSAADKTAQFRIKSCWYGLRSRYAISRSGADRIGGQPPIMGLQKKDVTVLSIGSLLPHPPPALRPTYQPVQLRIVVGGSAGGGAAANAIRVNAKAETMTLTAAEKRRMIPPDQIRRIR